MDQDCDDASDFDQDGDGYDRDADCDDTDADAGGGEEDWNRRDDDCDDWFDEDLTVGAVATTRLLGDTNGLALGYDGALGLTDLDGDGLDDVVAASDQVDDGVAYVVAGVDLPGLDANISAHSHAQLVGTSSTPLATVSLAMGDLTGDSGTDLLVGAELGRAGRVWVLDGDRVTGGVSLESSADAEITGDSGWDDLHLAAVADIDGDGVADLVTGAVYDDYQDATTRSDTGNIAWFAGGAFTGELSLGDAAGQIHGAEEGDSLGASLVVGDWNADGYGDAAAGAPGFDGSGSDCGAIVIFAGAASPSWDGTAEAAWLTIAGDVSGLQLGAEPLPAPGDIDGDGRDDLGIRSAASGEAWIFTVLADRDGAYTVADADVSVEEEATALALADVEGYGFAAVILGEAGDDTVGTDAGAIAVWRGPVGTGVLGEPEVRIVGDAAGDALGSGLAVGDTDGDGRVDLLVGAPGVDDGERAGGAVYVVTGR